MEDGKYTIKELESLLQHKRKRPLSNINVMDYLVIICIITVVAFVSVSLYFYYTQSIPPTSELMKYFFAFFGGELLAMAGITITKNVSENKKRGVDE